MTPYSKDKRDQMVAYMRQVAAEENKKNNLNQISLEDLLDNTGRKRFLIIAAEAIGDILYATCLLKSFKESYPDYDLYLATKPEYIEIFDGNEYLHKVIVYAPQMDSEIWATGQGDYKGLFDGYCHLFAYTQRFLNYLTNDNIALELK